MNIVNNAVCQPHDRGIKNGTKRLDASLEMELAQLEKEGRAKAPERIITGYIPPEGDKGPRYRLQGSAKEFIRLNSNAYLSLSAHPEVMQAADRATAQFGVGPGAVRFIDGTFTYHDQLEKKLPSLWTNPGLKFSIPPIPPTAGLL